MPDATPGYRRIIALAWPIILANCTVPLLGLVDTAVIGHTGQVTELGAIALGALVFNFVYWGCGFLRMGTTGLCARAAGRGDELEVRAAMARAVLLGAFLGVLLLIAQLLVIRAALALLGASSEVEALTAEYLAVRLWGAPASLATFALLGFFIGLERTDLLLKVQLFLNLLNIGLDLLFAGVMGWGVQGIALGTAMSEWLAFAFAASLGLRLLRERAPAMPLLPWDRIREAAGLLRALSVNRDIFLRTLLLLFGFAWFTNQGAAFGDVILAGNHILLQFITFSAYFLDGYAHAIEPLVGRAVEARKRKVFDQVLLRSLLLAGATSLILAILLIALGAQAATALTDLEPVTQAALHYLPYCIAYVGVAFAAFQLDGVFIGATATAQMRNASLLSLMVFLGLALWLTPGLGNAGLWLAFVGFVVARAGALALYLPSLRRGLDEDLETHRTRGRH